MGTASPLDGIAMTPDEAIIEKIEHAFKGVTAIGGASIADCIIAHGYGCPESIKEAVGKEERRDWHKIKDEWIEEYANVFCFANDIGAKFLLAPYMIWVVRNAKSSNSCSIDFTIYNLDSIDKKESFAALLTDNQKGAIRDFLSFMRNQRKNHCDLAAVNSALEKWKCL